MSPRTAITAIFALNGAGFAAWYARLPAITDELGLSPGEIGIALLGAPIGLLLAQGAIGALIARHGSYALLRASPLAFALIVLPALAWDLPSLCLAVALTGAANGAIDVTMNAQGLVVERAARVRLFTTLHAGFSFGALGGALAAAAVAAAGVDALPHLAAWGLAAALVGAVALRGLIRDQGAPRERREGRARLDRRLLALGLLAFCCLMAEGSVTDWSALFMDRVAGASAGAAPLGLAAFSLTMGFGRLAGDALGVRYGARGRPAPRGRVRRRVRRVPRRAARDRRPRRARRPARGVAARVRCLRARRGAGGRAHPGLRAAGWGVVEVKASSGPQPRPPPQPPRPPHLPPRRLLSARASPPPRGRRPHGRSSARPRARRGGRCPRG